jgi:ribosomal protein L19
MSNTEIAKTKKFSTAQVVTEFNVAQFERLINGKKIDEIKSGDLINIKVKSVSNKKLSSHEGVCIYVKESKSKCVYRIGIVKSFLHGVQTVINFNALSPTVVSIDLVRAAKKVKRSKQYERVAEENKR